MRTHAASLMLVASTFLAACGGGGGGGGRQPPPPPPPPAPHTRVFAGPVQGMSFSTPSRSGLTNALGQFTYLPGETVTFSVGGVQVGAAPGALAMSLFHLRGATPPATEAALRAELVTENNVTDFDRVANLNLLFMALDQDANPANGFDLTGWNAALAGASLNIEVPLYQFQERVFDRYARGHAINAGVSPALAVTQLYKHMGLAVPVLALTSWTQDSGDDGTINLRIAYEYDANGRVVVARHDNDGDGNPNALERSTYDAQGRVLTYIFDTDSNDDGTPESRRTTTSTYDARGNLTSETTDRDTGVDGTVEFRQGSTFTYDSSGRLIGRANFNESSGTVTRQDIEYEYNAAGDLLTREQLTDIGDDDVIDDRHRDVYTYDAAGNTLTELFEHDSDADGVAESQARLTYVLDAAGRMVSVSVEEDTNEDGTADWFRTQTWIYDSNGRPTSTHEESQHPIGFSENQRTWTYNAHGDALTEVMEGIELGAQYRTVTTRTYDTAGNRATEHMTSDDGADGTLERVSDLTATYDTRLAPSLIAFQSAEGTDIEAWRQAFVNDTSLTDGVFYLVESYGLENEN
jgi:hypothetical protein